MILRNNANLSTGGTATDVTDDVHPEIAARAVSAAQMVGLDLCGVDVVCESVLTPLENQSGGVIEVNAAPGLRMHLQPSFGKGRPVGEAVMAMAKRVGADAYRRQQQVIMSRPDSRPLLPSIAVPTLVAVGDSDVVTPLARAREIHAGIAGSRLYVFDDCGHLPAMEKPEETSALLRQWLTW